MLDKKSPVPLYAQLMEIIIDRINNHQYEIGKTLPGEFELCNEFDISRTTVREAINKLVEQGYIERRRGVGSFVQIPPKTNKWNLQVLRSFRDEFKEKGYRVTTKVVSIELINCDPNIKAVFNNAYDLFYKLERVRYLNQIPVLVTTTYVPAQLCNALDSFDFSGDASLYYILQNKYDISLKTAEKIFSVDMLTDNDAKLLDINKKMPMQIIRTTTYDENNRPVEYSISRDRGDISTYSVSLKF